MASLEELKQGQRVSLTTTGRAPTKHEGKIVGFTEKGTHRGGAVRAIVEVSETQQIKAFPGQITVL